MDVVSKYVRQPDAGELIEMSGPTAGNIRILIDPKSTNEDTAVCTLIQTLDPGAAVPVHYHQSADQVLYFLSGEGVVSILGQEAPAEPGTTVFVPRGSDHGITNTGEASLSFLETTTPPGFENAFREMGTLVNPDPSELARVAAKHDILISPP
jgi:mannose-6-phosphate isomerase-like protein (cupin superfamily)